MAKLNSAGLLSFSAAAAAITLTTSQKLIKNFSYYKSQESDVIYRSDLLEVMKSIRFKSFSLHNMMENDRQSPVFYVAVAGNIHESLEELHRKILFFEADDISEIIPLIDTERAFWSNCSDPDFYNYTLTKSLEKNTPETLRKIEDHLNRLPNYVTL